MFNMRNHEDILWRKGQQIGQAEWCMQPAELSCRDSRSMKLAASKALFPSEINMLHFDFYQDKIFALSR